MMLSELIRNLKGMKSEQGDMQVFCGDMEVPVFDVREADEEPEKYGKKYLYIETP